MDPDSNLAEQLSLKDEIMLAWDHEEEIAPHTAMRLAELVEALDEWIRKGGALPSAWKRAR